jgi:hypothetical protein
MNGYAKGDAAFTTATTNRADMSAEETRDKVRFPRSRISRGAAPANSRDHVVGDGVLAEVGGENGHCPPDQ